MDWMSSGLVDSVGIHVQHLAIKEISQIFGLPVES
jgi:hypothetical protein